MHATLPLMQISDFPAIQRNRTDTLQVNLGYKCNQSCLHCHVNAGPTRTEMMSREMVFEVIAYLRAANIKTLDVTGGAPELNPHFRLLVEAARDIGVRVMDRCNLTILHEPEQEGLADFLCEHNVDIVASLPCYLEENVDRQRGKGVFDASIRALQLLNAKGYGKPGSPLKLSLVYNPQGPVLPPSQGPLETDYRKHLGAHFGVEFTELYVLTNMPIQRFGSTLHGSAEERLPATQSRFGDVPLAAVGRLSGLRLRLRFQPDAGFAAGVERQTAHASARADGCRYRRQSDRGQGSLLRLHRRARLELRRRARLMPARTAHAARP
jgi:radical SAM/Cys-rich protein